MPPDAGDRLQFRLRQERQFGRIVGDTEIEIGLARHQQHARADRPQRTRQIAAIQRVVADVRGVPGAKLRVLIGGRTRAEPILPVGAQERLEVRRAEIGLRPRRQMQPGTIEILAERPRRIDAPERPLGRARLGREAAVADVLRRGLQCRHQAAQEHLVVHGGARDAAVHHDAIHRVGEQRRPVIGLQRSHRPAVHARDTLDAEQSRAARGAGSARCRRSSPATDSPRCSRGSMTARCRTCRGSR